MRKRLINRSQQGDLGEASAVEYLTRCGAVVLAPLGHSPDFDLVAQMGSRLLRIQVKTSTFQDFTRDEQSRWMVQLATSGGNQSWTGETKHLDADRIDLLFALVGDGRRWLIPAQHLEAKRSITVGGRKYSEFEVEPTQAIDDLVYGDLRLGPRIENALGVYPSGQRTAPVKRQAYAFAGSNPAAPISSQGAEIDRPAFERKLARNGQTILGAKRRLGIPVGPCIAAGLEIGQRMRVHADGPGRVILERIDPPPQLLPNALPADGNPEPKR